MDRYEISCDCKAVTIALEGVPKVRGHCHCNACRRLLDVPYHSVTAWNPDQVEVVKGDDNLISFQHPDLKMKKIFCADCGEVLYNTNAVDWRVVSQRLIAKNFGGTVPGALTSQSHFFYASRIIDVDDDLPKKE
ncbi:GFA family protein [Roseibium sp.]|uniref:GFA family protein n=1 Tax=Roseibium sp. TaxID=1936156 RepID=UPI003B521AB0